MSAAEKKVPGTAVATALPAEDFANVGLTPAAKAAMDELEVMRQAGMVAVEKRKVLTTLSKMVQGLSWGDTFGGNLSSATQYAIAEVCYVTGANPALHLFILGGLPYLNARFYEDLMNQHPHFIRYSQISLMPAMSAQLHKNADAALEEVRTLLRDAQELGMPELREDAVRLRQAAVVLRERAREIDEKRVLYGIPESAAAAYESTIVRYAPDAPLDAIRDGVIDGERFVQRIHECNWVDRNDGKDPVGKSNPDTTARTRSLRRAGQKAFSAWMEPKLREVERFERQIQAEWREIREDRNGARAALPAAGEPQAVRTGNGEPSAANANGAKELPVEEPQQQKPPAVPGVVVPEKVPYTETKFTDPPPFDPVDARKAFFATLRDAGFDDRKQWVIDAGLPESTKVWTREHYERAMDLLLGPQRKKLAEGAKLAGVDAEQLAQIHFQKPVEKCTWKELAALNQHVASVVDGGEPQGRML